MVIEHTTFNHGDTALAALLSRPDAAAGAVPAVVTAQGFGNVKEVTLPSLAEHLARAGIATLAFDYAGFGDSGGEPRQHVNPADQLAQFRTALGHLGDLDGIDADRLGVWGPSLAGGHAIHLAATDHRVRCAVAVVPFVDTDATETPPQLLDAIIADAMAREQGGAYGTIPILGAPGTTAVITTDSAAAVAESLLDAAPNLRNEVTLASLIEMAGYKPLAGVDALRAPLRVVLATDDSVNPAAAARTALEPLDDVDVVELTADHFSVFTDHLGETIAASVEWFSLNL